MKYRMILDAEGKYTHCFCAHSDERFFDTFLSNTSGESAASGASSAQIPRAMSVAFVICYGKLPLVKKPLPAQLQGYPDRLYGHNLLRMSYLDAKGDASPVQVKMAYGRLFASIQPCRPKLTITVLAFYVI